MRQSSRIIPSPLPSSNSANVFFPYFGSMAERTATTAQIKEFYDGHAKEVQQHVGVNIRHQSIMKRLRRAGLRKDHRVLEVGCGIGTLTSLLAKYISQGTIHAVDISEGAIRFAKDRFKSNSRITFQVSDMSDFTSDQLFDRIVLPDVLEHIPEEQHAHLFGVLAKHLTPDGTICIHIPDPVFLDQIRRERPEILQIIDQSLSIQAMAERFSVHKMVLHRYERYGLWIKEPEYDWVEFRLFPSSTTRTSWSKLKTKLNEWHYRI